MTLATSSSITPNSGTSGLAVLDASGVAAFAFIDEPYHAQAQQLITSLAQQQARLIAPPLFESEIDSILRRRVYLGSLTIAAATAALQLIDALQVEIIQDVRVRSRARQIAEQLNQVRVYDSTYAALAELQGCPLWTADERFYNTAQNTLDFVRFIGAIATS